MKSPTTPAATQQYPALACARRTECGARAAEAGRGVGAGRFLGRRKIDGKGLRSDLIVEGGVLYVFGNSGSLHALEIRSR